MKIIIIYHSEHHNNTKKLLDALECQGNVTLLKDVDANGAALSGLT